MKAKAKFDPKAIQRFFIDHTEKLVIGLVAVLFLFFAYSSFTLEGYKEKPEKLKEATDHALATIAKGPPAGKIEDVTKFPPYADEIENFKKPIDPRNYPFPVGLAWKPFAPLRPRESPKVLAVEQVRAIPGRGAMPLVDENTPNAGNGGVGGRRFIVITGLVPYKKQLAEYRTKFEGAAGNDPGKDVPSYRSFFVQRAEVVPGAEPKWEGITVFSPKVALAKMGGQMAEEIADPRFVHPYLTSPLPMRRMRPGATKSFPHRKSRLRNAR